MPGPKISRWQYRLQHEETSSRQAIVAKALEHGIGLVVLQFPNGGSVMFYYPVDGLDKVEPILKLVFQNAAAQASPPNEEQPFQSNAKAKAPGYA